MFSCFFQKFIHFPFCEHKTQVFVLSIIALWNCCLFWSSLNNLTSNAVDKKNFIEFMKKFSNFIFSGHHRCRLLKPTKYRVVFAISFHCFEISINFVFFSARQLYHHLMKFQQHQISWSQSFRWVELSTTDYWYCRLQSRRIIINTNWKRNFYYLIWFCLLLQSLFFMNHLVDKVTFHDGLNEVTRMKLSTIEYLIFMEILEILWLATKIFCNISISNCDFNSSQSIRYHLNFTCLMSTRWLKHYFINFPAYNDREWVRM